MRDSSESTLNKLLISYKEKLLRPELSTDLFIASLDDLEILSANEYVGAQVISFLTELAPTAAVAGAGAASPALLQTITSNTNAGAAKVVKHYLNLLIKLSATERITHEQLSPLLASISEAITKKPEFLDGTLEELVALFDKTGKAEELSPVFKKILQQALAKEATESALAISLVKQFRVALSKKVGTPEADLSIDQLLAEISHESITTKASPTLTHTFRKNLGALLASELKSKVLLSDTAQLLLLTLKGQGIVARPYGSLLDDDIENLLPCIRHGLTSSANADAIYYGTAIKISIFSLIERKLKAGDLQLLEEILEADSYLMNFIQSSLITVNMGNTALFASLVFAVADLALSTHSSIHSANLLNFLRTYVVNDNAINMTHLIGQTGTDSERAKLFDLLTQVSEQHPLAVLSCLLLTPVQTNNTAWPVNLGILTLSNTTGPDGTFWRADEKSVEKYINLLELISRKLKDVDSVKIFQGSLNTLDNGTKSFAEHLLENLPRRTDLILRLMLNNFLSPTVLEKLKGIKHTIARELIDHSRRLEKAEAVALLSSALKEDSYLGSYFYLQRGLKACALGQRGALDTLFAELKSRDPITAAAFIPAKASTSTAAGLFRVRAESVDDTSVGVGACAAGADAGSGFEMGALLSNTTHGAPKARGGIN